MRAELSPPEQNRGSVSHRLACVQGSRGTEPLPGVSSYVPLSPQLRQSPPRFIATSNLSSYTCVSGLPRWPFDPRTTVTTTVLSVKGFCCSSLVLKPEFGGRTTDKQQQAPAKGKAESRTQTARRTSFPWGSLSSRWLFPCAPSRWS